MKTRLISAVAVLTLGASLAIAAPHEGTFGGKHHRRHGEFGEKFAQKLNLSDAQKEQIRAIKKETREQNASFFQSLRDSRKEFRAAKEANDTAKLDALKAARESQRAQIKQIRDAERQRVLAVLTPEQRAELEKLKAERAERRGRRSDQQ